MASGITAFTLFPSLHSLSAQKQLRSSQQKPIPSATTSSTIGHRLVTYNGHSQNVYTLAWALDGKQVASGGHDTTVQIWNPVTAKRILIYRGHSASINALAWSPTGNRIASTGTDLQVQIWLASSGERLLTYTGHADAINVRTLSWSPDGRYIASGVSRSFGEG